MAARASVIEKKTTVIAQVRKEEVDDFFLSMIKQKGFCHVSLLHNLSLFRISNARS